MSSFAGISGVFSGVSSLVLSGLNAVSNCASDLNAKVSSVFQKNKDAFVAIAMVLGTVIMCSSFVFLVVGLSSVVLNVLLAGLALIAFGMLLQMGAWIRARLK